MGKKNRKIGSKKERQVIVELKEMTSGRDVRRPALARKQEGKNSRGVKKESGKIRMEGVYK